MRANARRDGCTTSANIRRHRRVGRITGTTGQSGRSMRSAVCYDRNRKNDRSIRQFPHYSSRCCVFLSRWAFILCLVLAAGCVSPTHLSGGQQGTGSTGTGVHRRGQQGHPYSNCLHFANWVSSEHFVFAQRSAVACREILSRTRSHCWLATREADRSVLSQSDPPAGAKQSTARHCCRSPRR